MVLPRTRSRARGGGVGEVEQSELGRGTMVGHSSVAYSRRYNGRYNGRHGGRYDGRNNGRYD